MATYQCEISLIGQSFNNVLDQMFNAYLAERVYKGGAGIAPLQTDGYCELQKMYFLPEEGGESDFANLGFKSKPCQILLKMTIKRFRQDG